MITVLLEDVPLTEKEWAERLPSWMRKETDQAQINEVFARGAADSRGHAP
jgi:hypothetical protein